MSFYFCGRYINTDCDDKYLERAMFEAIPLFRDFDHRYGYEAWKNGLEDFFNYFYLTTEEKCRSARVKLDREAYYQWRDNHKSLCQYWFILQYLLLTWYVPPIHSFEPDCREPNAESTKVEADSEPSVIVELDVLDKPESEVAADLVLLQEETPSRPHRGEKASY